MLHPLATPPTTAPSTPSIRRRGPNHRYCAATPTSRHGPGRGGRLQPKPSEARTAEKSDLAEPPPKSQPPSPTTSTHHHPPPPPGREDPAEVAARPQDHPRPSLPQGQIRPRRHIQTPGTARLIAAHHARRRAPRHPQSRRRVPRSAAPWSDRAGLRQPQPHKGVRVPTATAAGRASPGRALWQRREGGEGRGRGEAPAARVLLLPPAGAPEEGERMTT